MNELINKENEWIIHFMGSLDRLLDNVEHLTANYRPTLNGERFFTDKEVSARLKVSRRTLQDYRNEGALPTSSWEVKSSTVNPTSKVCWLTATNPPTD